MRQDLLFGGLVLTQLVALTAACGPELKPLVVAPDNATSQGDAEVGPNQRGVTLKVAPISAEEFATLYKADLAPLCTVRGGKATPGPKFTEMEGLIAAWTKARAIPSPQAGEKAPEGKAGGLGPRYELVTAPAEGDPLNALSALTVECNADKPVLHVNGQTRSVDVVYGDSSSTQFSVSNSAAHVFVLAGWNAATSELTVVRARTGSPPQGDQAAEYGRWNAVVYRNLQGYLPTTARPVSARSVDGNGLVNTMELVFPMTGMAINADALIVRAPLDASPGKSPAETVELDAVLRRR